MKTKKQKPKTAEQLLVDRILGDIQRARKEKGVAPEVATKEAELDQQAAEIFKQTTNRDYAPKLDTATALDRIDRDGGPTFDRIGDWKPVMAVDAEALKPLAADIAAARERVATEKQKNMTTAERELAALEQQQAKILADEAAKAEHSKRLADAKIKTTLEKLRALDERTAKDESWDYAETVAIARAIFAIETQGSDLDAALKLADEAFGIDNQKKLDALTAHEKEVARLRAEIDALADKPAEQQSESKSDPPAQQQTESRAPTMYSLLDTWNKLKADPNATNGAIQAAGKAWYDALRESNKAAAQSGDGSAPTEGAAT
jgi:hypothetical protein